jgi:dihydroorotate dehydrogenase (NAD+) catalytic subunit
MLNAIGLQNIGVEAFLEEKLPELVGVDTAVVCNVFGERIEEYVAVVERLNGREGVAGLELNVSCPHVERGGVEFGQDPRLLHEVTAACRRATELPLWVKLTPGVTDIVETAQAAREAGADALSLVNTYRGMAVNLESRRPIPPGGVGGLSGPAIKPMALYAVHRVARSVPLPVVGIGGIRSAADVLEFLVAGARAVQVGTMNYVEPGITARLAGEVRAWLEARGIADVNDLVGSLRTGKETP